MDESRVICSGYLKKSPPERRLMRTWHKRYFVLKTNKTLAYYPSEKEKKPVKEPIDLNLCQSIEANLHHKDKNFKHVFSIITTMRTYFLVAETREDMDMWVNNLCKCCGFEKQDGKPSPDFLKNRLETRPKDVVNLEQHSLPSSPMTPSPPPVCPLSPPKTKTMPTCRKDRSWSDPPDSDDIFRRAERQYIENKEQRKSCEIGMSFPGLPNTAHSISNHLPEFQTHLAQSDGDVDGGYDSLKVPIQRDPRKQHLTNYDVVPRPRPLSTDVYDIVSKPRVSDCDIYDIPPRPSDDDVYDIPPKASNEELYDVPPKASNDDIYDIPPSRNSLNYDVVPAPRPASSHEQHGYVNNRYSYNPEDSYDTLPAREDNLTHDVYDIVPPPRPHKNDSEYYDTLPSSISNNNDENFENFYDTPPQVVPPSRPPKGSSLTRAKDHYDIVPAPDSRRPLEASDLSNDHLQESLQDELYDVPPRSNNDDVYDQLQRQRSEDYYDIVQPLNKSESHDAPPMIDRSVKPPPVCRSTKPVNADPRSFAPPIDRKLKPMPLKRPEDSDHSYENLKNQLSKENAYQPNDYCDMQPYRSDDTRCYSFSKEKTVAEPTECYEEMVPGVMKRESGVHCNSSSSEDGDSDDRYLTMEAPEKIDHHQRKATLQYCEVEIVEGQNKVPAPRRNVDSHYTTINEESTQAFLQTCLQQKTSRN